MGDAASFIDPYYSPGLDHAAMSVYATARILEADLRTGRASLSSTRDREAQRGVRAQLRPLALRHLPRASTSSWETPS